MGELELKLSAVDRAQELREGEIFWGSSWNDKKGRKEHLWTDGAVRQRSSRRSTTYLVM